MCTKQTQISNDNVSCPLRLELYFETRKYNNVSVQSGHTCIGLYYNTCRSILQQIRASVRITSTQVRYLAKRSVLVCFPHNSHCVVLKHILNIAAGINVMCRDFVHMYTNENQYHSFSILLHNHSCCQQQTSDYLMYLSNHMLTKLPTTKTLCNHHV